MVLIGFWKSLASFSMGFSKCCLQDELYSVMFWHTTAFHIVRIETVIEICRKSHTLSRHVWVWDYLPGLQNIYNLFFPRMLGFWFGFWFWFCFLQWGPSTAQTCRGWGKRVITAPKLEKGAHGFSFHICVYTLKQREKPKGLCLVQMTSKRQTK